jgi:hypothetical protein
MLQVCPSGQSVGALHGVCPVTVTVVDQV